MVLASRRERVYQRFPNPVVGYELDPECGYFSVIIPEATTNLVTNPSVEAGVTTGWAAYDAGAAMAAIATWQAYGAYGLQLTPAAAVESGCYWGTVTLVVSTTYTASVTIQGEEGKKYYIWFASNAGALIGTKREWIGTGHKQRIWVTHTETTGAARRVYITRDIQYTDTNLFYADALQVEAKSYPTTYCDGDQVGFLVNETPAPYLWTGTRRASASTRSAQTRSGGREVSLLSLGLRVLAVLGLGMSPLVDQALPIPGRGELAQGTGTTAREFTLVTALYADGPGPRHLQALRSGLIDAFKPDLVTIDQPLILRYQACDDEGDPLGESLDIICKYRTGLEGNWDNHQQERIPLTFKMHLPLIQNTYDNGTALDYQITVGDADYILMRTAAGVWQDMAGGAGNTVRSIIPAPDGTLYIGGQFVNLGGADGDYIVNWDGTAFNPLGTGADNDIYCLALAPDGTLYAGGAFLNIGGGAANRIAQWDGANWTAMGTGANVSVLALAIGPDGSLYAGGEFTAMGGVANTAYIARWDGAAWNSVGGGANAVITSLAFGKDGILYAGGNFTNLGGANGDRIAQWDGATWGPLGTGADDIVRALAVGLDGSIYAAGDFLHIDGIPANLIAKWNGVKWSPLGSGLGSGNAADEVDSLFVNPDGTIYAGGFFTMAGGVALPDRIALWNGSVWIPLDVDLFGTPIIYAIYQSPGTGNLYLGFSTTGAAVAAAVTVAIINVGSSIAYPIITFTGPGTVYQVKSYTTGRIIFFDLTLLAGETAVLNLNPTNISFQSSFRGNILDTILQGSSLNFPLLPGSNDISAFIGGTVTAATAITMPWREQYWSLDGAAWK